MRFTLTRLHRRLCAVAALAACLCLPAAAREQEVVIPLGDRTDKIETFVTPEGPRALVGLLDEQALALVDLAGRKQLARLDLGIRPLVVRRLGDTGLVAVGGPSNGTLIVADTRRMSVLKSVDLGAGIFDIAVDPRRSRIVATHPGAERISVVNADGKVRVFPTPAPPLAAAIEPTSGHLYLTLGSKDPLGLAILNLETGEVLARLRSGATPEDIALDFAHGQAVLLNSGSNDLSVVPLDGNAARFRTIGLDWRPTRLTLSADGRYAYVSSGDSDRLQLVDLEAGRVVATRTLGRLPTGIGLLPDGILVVAEAGTQALRVISAPVPNETGGPAAPGSVAGVITDVTGKPINVGELKVEGRTVPILPDGSFLIPKLPPGKHLVDVVVPGFPQFTARLESRPGYVVTEDIHMPPKSESETVDGIGFIADIPVYSDLLARSLVSRLARDDARRKVILLNGPLGPHPEFTQLSGLVRNLNLLDRDNRLTDDLEKLQTIGRSLKLRYIVLTQVQFSRGYNTAGNPIVNTLLRFFVPVSLPNFTPNELRSQGVAVVIDLQKAHSGDKAVVFKADDRDDKGGPPLMEEESDGLFRLEVKKIADNILGQWQEKPPFQNQG